MSWPTVENLIDCTKRATNATGILRIYELGEASQSRAKFRVVTSAACSGGPAAQFRQAADGLHDERRLVPFPTVRNGREIGRVRLDQQAILWGERRRFSNIVRFWECQNAAEAEMKAQFQRLFRLARAASEAVHDAAVWQAVLSDHGEGIVPGFACVNDDGPFRLSGQNQLRREHGALHVARRKVVMVIETDLAYCQHLGMAREFGQAVQGLRSDLSGVVGMHADRCEDESVLLGEPDAGLEIRRAAAGSNRHNALDAGGAGALDGGIAVGGELLIIQVTVRIDQFHFNRAPTGISSRKPARTGLPPSIDAATIMPLEVRPRNLRGARLATMTTLRPITGGFPDGVYFVALAPVGNPDLVLSSIAQGIGLRDVGDRPLLDRLRSHLENAQVLILLDNFEHLIAAAPAVAQILQATVALRIMVTSRAPLHVSGEQEFEVPPLRVPDPQFATVAAVAGCESVRLFAERAQAVWPGFVLDEENAALIAGIARRLDGLPLAVELAAAHVKLLPLASLLARLEQSLPVLVGGARDLPQRQQTLRGTIAWSYGLLGAGARRLLAACSVFRGGISLDAVRVSLRGVYRPGHGAPGRARGARRPKPVAPGRGVCGSGRPAVRDAVHGP